MGHGIIGGRLISMSDIARISADSAVRILNGEPASSVRVPSQLPASPVFDWRELQRWNIDESRLPPGSEVRYRRPGLWAEYRGVVLVTAAALFVQGLLIAGLLVQRRARRRAEIESRRNLALAADTTRRVTMSALTGSIAHELGQPLSAMIYNTEALELMVNSRSATPESILEVLADIREDGVLASQIIERHRAMLRSRELQKTPVDIESVIEDALSLVAHELRERQINVTVRRHPAPCVIEGDAVLLQQVLVNLVVNAMDAMTGLPEERRQLIVSTEKKRDEVEIRVQDSGPGLSAEIIGKVFAPFVTTKAHGIGIGLPIARNIVEAHRGSISVSNNPEGGATFAITLPARSEAVTASASAPSPRPGSDRSHPTASGSSTRDPA
jgi:signal transduction histidine kinase